MKYSLIKSDINNTHDYGFIVLRSVKDPISNAFWQRCINSISFFYPSHKIVIIDDDSCTEYLTHIHDKNIIIIQSEFKKRGELLPYYYYLKYGLNWFSNAIIIQDSVFIQKYIDFKCDQYAFLWSFEHNWDHPIDELNILSELDNKTDLLQFHEDTTNWIGCFGAMTMISYEYLKFVDSIHNISLLLPHIYTKYHRILFERIIASILQFHYKPNKIVILDDIHKYIHKHCKYGIPYTKYISEIEKYNDLPIMKIWANR